MLARNSFAEAEGLCNPWAAMRPSKLSLYLCSVALLADVVVAQQPALTIDRSLGPTRVGISGGLGQDYTLQASSNNLGTWDFLLKLSLTNSPQNWFDSAS